MPSSSPRSTPAHNVLLISHCNFTGNSAFHVYSIAAELVRHGFSPAIAVPSDPGGVADAGHPSFPVVSYRDVRRGRLRFDDGGPVDLVHAFTPREPVRRLTAEVVRDHRCRYVVHLEDNEGAIIRGRAHPRRAPDFVAHAAGVTVVIDRLLELKPEDVPGVVVWPGFDEAILSPRRPRDEVRRRLGVRDEDLVLVYNGNVHESNLGDVRDLYLAVSELRRAGHPAVLVRTGWDFVPSSALPTLGDGVRELGWVWRSDVPELLAAADVLVQPGRDDAYNAYRFPSKVPEFLASGRPVVLPRTNIGLHLKDSIDALLMERGDTTEIIEQVTLLAANTELRVRIGESGRAFALGKLRWSKNVESLLRLYTRLGERDSSAARDR